jgi:hypothetical protein
MKTRKHSSKSGTTTMVQNGMGIKSGSIQPTFEQVQAGAGQAGESGSLLANHIWAVLINK